MWTATTAQWLAVARLLLDRSIFLYTSSLLARIVLIQTTSARILFAISPSPCSLLPWRIPFAHVRRNIATSTRAHRTVLSTAPALPAILHRVRLIFICPSPRGTQVRMG